MRDDLRYYVIIKVGDSYHVSRGYKTREASIRASERVNGQSAVVESLSSDPRVIIDEYRVSMVNRR